MKKFLTHSLVWTGLIVWIVLICFLGNATVPGVVFAEDSWVGVFWLSGISCILLLAAGIAAVTSQMD